MVRRPSPTLANAVAPGVRVSRIEPLQRRIERNRLRFVGFMMAFNTAIAVSAALTVGVAVSLFVIAIGPRFMTEAFRTLDEAFGFIGAVVAFSFFVTFAFSWMWSLYRIARAEHLIIARLEARVPKVGTLMSTRGALHDMTIAAGLKVTPTLYVIDTPNVNACVVGRSPKRVRICVTRGFIERIPLDEQRAVFANLVARVISYDTLWATSSSALMGPIHAWRNGQLRRDPRIVAEPDAPSTPPPGGLGGGSGQAGGFVLAALVTYGFAVVFSEILSWYHQEAAWRAAEKADAEGMMLLKDPHSMLGAIEHVLDRNNHVPTAGDAYSPLFFCWAGFGFAPDDDPEMRRVARLRETLGAEGVAYVPRPNVPNWDNPPVAPRVELLETLPGYDAPADGGY